MILLVLRRSTPVVHLTDHLTKGSGSGFLKTQSSHFNMTCLYQTADVNGDGSSDIVCTGLDGGMIVWEGKHVNDNANIYQANSKWTDVNFGFCVHTNKMVIILPKPFYKHEANYFVPKQE